MPLRNGNVADARHDLARALCEFRLGIKSIDLTDAAVAKDRNDRLGLSLEMGLFRREQRSRRRRQLLPRQHVGQRDAGNPAAQAAEQFTSRIEALCHCSSAGPYCR